MGAATKMEEYVPDATPTNSAKAKSFNVCTPTNNNAPIGNNTTREVLTDRIRVWFRDMFTTAEYVSRATDASDSVFSFTLSKMTTVSYSEYPRMVRMAITVSGVTSRPTSAYTPAVMMRSWARATSAPMAIFHSKRAVMYSVTRTRNTIRPTSIFREIVLPNVGPTSCSLISFGEIPAAPASSALS